MSNRLRRLVPVTRPTIRSEYLVNPFGKGDQHYRLVLKPGDAETLLALIHDRPLPAEPSPRIVLRAAE